MHDCGWLWLGRVSDIKCSLLLQQWVTGCSIRLSHPHRCTTSLYHGPLKHALNDNNTISCMVPIFHGNDFPFLGIREWKMTGIPRRPGNWSPGMQTLRPDSTTAPDDARVTGNWCRKQWWRQAELTPDLHSPQALVLFCHCSLITVNRKTVIHKLHLRLCRCCQGAHSHARCKGSAAARCQWQRPLCNGCTSLMTWHYIYDVWKYNTSLWRI